MRNTRNLKGIGQYGTIGIEMVLSMLLGLWVGTKLDDKLGTSPWMAVVWFFFGCAAAGRSVYRAWKSMQIDAKKEEEREGNPAPAFPDDKEIAWRRAEERKARDIRDAELEAKVSELENDVNGAKMAGEAPAADDEPAAAARDEEAEKR